MMSRRFAALAPRSGQDPEPHSLRCARLRFSWRLLDAAIVSVDSLDPCAVVGALRQEQQAGSPSALTATTTPQLNWQVSVGRASPGSAPPSRVGGYAASSDARLCADPVTGRVVWRVMPARRSPPRADEDVVVGTDKGETLAFDADGKPTWTRACRAR
jgi:hypothetical protein